MTEDDRNGRGAERVIHRAEHRPPGTVLRPDMADPEMVDRSTI